MTSQTLASRAEALATRLTFNLPAAALRMLAGRPTVREGQTLDVQIQLALRLQKLRGDVALGSGTVEQERINMDTQCALFAPEPKRAVATRNLTLAGADGPIGARLYRPRHCGHGSPALVFYHGGGYTLGSLESHDGVCRVLAERAHCGVIAVDYRLAPEHKAPAGIDDAIAAFDDIAARADELDINAKRLAVGGDSAGGNFSAVIAQARREAEHAPCFQLLFYPGTDFAGEYGSVKTYGQGFLLEKSSMDWFRDHYLAIDSDPTDPRLSPIYGDCAGVAPALVMTGGFDPLRDEGEAYAERLRTAGVAVDLIRKPSLIHGFINFAGILTAANAALDEAAQKLRVALAG